MTVTAITWTGVDGSVWDLAGGTQGVQLAQGVAGLHLPAFKQQVSQAARVPGQRYLGTAYDARDVMLPIVVGDPANGISGAAWTALDDAWWASLSPEVTGTLTVASTTGSRYLRCRLGAAADPTYLTDPSVAGVAAYALTLEADQPFWTGPDVMQTFQIPTTSQPYYGGSGGGGFGPPLYISPASALSNATISNPGDRAAYSRWTVVGPGQVTFTIAGHSTTLPMLASGQTVSIDTNPLAQNAVRDVSGGGSVNFWPYMTSHDFWFPIPAGQAGYPIPISVSGGSPSQTQITVAVTPLYNRAW